MKRFLVFTGDRFYPKGGAEDFRRAEDTYEEAIALTKMFIADADDLWANVLDIETGQVVYDSQDES